MKPNEGTSGNSGEVVFDFDNDDSGTYPKLRFKAVNRQDQYNGLAILPDVHATNNATTGSSILNIGSTSSSFPIATNAQFRNINLVSHFIGLLATTTTVSGNLTVTGNITGPTGTPVKTDLIDITSSLGSVAGSDSTGTYKQIAYHSYTKRSGTYIIVTVNSNYAVTGYGSDSITAKLQLDYINSSSDSIEVVQDYDGNGGGGTRSGTINGLMVKSVQPANTATSITVKLMVKRSSGDDAVSFSAVQFKIEECIA